MTYSINKTDGTIIAVVADGTIDTTTSLQLPGKLFQNYGEPINENLIKGKIYLKKHLKHVTNTNTGW